MTGNILSKRKLEALSFCDPFGRTRQAGNASGGTDPSSPGWPKNPLDARTETVPAGTVQLGWGQLDIGKEANYDGGADPGECPDPDEMKTSGTVQFANGVWTLTGSGEGFIHGWDQGNLVHFRWHWPAFPATWPDHRETLSWTRLVARGSAISAESSADGQTWQAIEHNDTDASHPEWYPFKLAALAGERYVGLVC